VVGLCDEAQVACVLKMLWGGPETAIIISTDLTHYLTYDQAKKIDALTATQIGTLETGQIQDDQACGAYPLRGFLREARHHSLQIQTLDLRNSGDTAGDKKRVVGYGAWSAQ
jgi:AmmeMemoRadiSam system protein B